MWLAAYVIKLQAVAVPYVILTIPANEASIFWRCFQAAWAKVRWVRLFHWCFTRTARTADWRGAPFSALAFSTLRMALQRDLIGLPAKKGMDIDGAIAAYRKNMALVLEYDSDGTRYSEKAKL
jgi:hypothetical protein